MSQQNYHQLRAIRDDFNDLSSRPALLYCLSTKMNAFHQANKDVLRAMNEKLTKLAAKHVQKDENGKPMMDKEGQWIFSTEEAKMAYAEEYNEFFNRSIRII